MLGIAWTWQAEVEGGFSRPLERRLATLEAAFRHGGAPQVDGHGHSRPRLLPGARLGSIALPLASSANGEVSVSSFMA